MSVVIQPVDLNKVKLVEQVPQLQCECCKYIAKPLSSNATCSEWLYAAHRIGWRHVTTEQYDFDCVCAVCLVGLIAPEAREAV
ncbi:hypothetical protein HG263_21750 [Pseudoalteromonas sp. JBTF-M23]|uniref:Uncharacterized protein n=1 Tax=Pseudoalteromonas caenipelagi TaxID=2726988 RepID=A0A849VH90_9GAMM|nr:hypothetical protein [Pseudoalteromonas caenipelagi]NOU53129.1 hypothetical protein [Pseudoalteromonas caenipelagi]